MFLMCFYTCLLFFSGCSSSIDSDKREPELINGKKEQIKEVAIEPANKKQHLLDKTSRESSNSPTSKGLKTTERKIYNYKYQNKDVLQYLKIRYLDKRKIEFDLLIEGSCKLSFKGIAVISEDSDLAAESGEDEETGIGYFINEYIFEKAGGCRFVVGIGLDEDKDKAAIVEDNCKFECPILSSTMRLVDK